MKDRCLNSRAIELFEELLESLQFGSTNEIARAREAWFQEYPTVRGKGGEKEKQKGNRSGIKVIGRSDLASGSGQLTLAAVMATECGARSATRDKIADALHFLSGTTQLMSPTYGHFRWMCEKPREWAQFHEADESLTLTTKGKNAISDEARRVAAAYRQKNRHFDSVSSDITDLYSQSIPETVRQQLVNARLGQGKFRKDLLKLWDDRCAVTGISLTEAIRASHIKPWKVSSHEERLDPYNGLPLVATLDALFDAGLITFNSAGEIQVSSQLRSKERKLLSLERLYLLRTPPKKTCEYLSHHMKHKFRQ